MTNHNELNYERGYQAGSQIMSDKVCEIRELLEHYRDKNKESDIVCIPRCVIENIICSIKF